jgi:hypothetical protein
MKNEITLSEIIKATKNLKPTISSIKAHPLVVDVSDERAYGDGWFVYLRDEIQTPGTETPTIHEKNLRDVVNEIRATVQSLPLNYSFNS